MRYEREVRACYDKHVSTHIKAPRRPCEGLSQHWTQQGVEGVGGDAEVRSASNSNPRQLLLPVHHLLNIWAAHSLFYLLSQWGSIFASLLSTSEDKILIFRGSPSSLAAGEGWIKLVVLVSSTSQLRPELTTLWSLDLVLRPGLGIHTQQTTL